MCCLAPGCGIPWVVCERYEKRSSIVTSRWQHERRLGPTGLYGRARHGEYQHELPAGALMRYSPRDGFYSRYWAHHFRVTLPDLDALADEMRGTVGSWDLTTLACHVIRRRLYEGPQLRIGSPPESKVSLRVVQRWEPDVLWRAGDHAIVAVPLPEAGLIYTPRVAEVLQVEEDHAILMVDGLPEPQVYALGLSTESLPSVDAYEALDKLADRADDEAARVGDVLWRFGARIVSQLLDWLESDRRFVMLEGQWFLAEQCVEPDEVQLVSLARAMFASGDGLLTCDALSLLAPGLRLEEPARRCGLVRAMMRHPELFRNHHLPGWPRWSLAAPPPGRYVAHHAVYDPETFVVLCRPGQRLDHRTVHRLWDVRLLRAALGPEGLAAPMGF